MASPSQNQSVPGGGGEMSSVITLASPKKQLPQIPDLKTQQEMNSKMAAEKERAASTNSALSPNKPNNSYGPFFLEYSLLAEYNLLQKQKLPGVYVIPSAQSTLYWNGMLFVRAGMYQEGVFRFHMVIPDNYPNGDSPRLIFEPAVFHPVIDPDSGELDVKRAFTKWRRNVNHIWQVLLYARRIFYKIDTKSPLNQEAATLYEQDIETYKTRVQKCIQECKQQVYEPPTSDDAHAIRFSSWDDQIHCGERQKMNLHTPKGSSSPSDDRGPSKAVAGGGGSSGLSWMTKGSQQVFSREESANA